MCPLAGPPQGEDQAPGPQLPSPLLALRPVSSRPNPKRSTSSFTLKEGTEDLGGGGIWAGLASSSVMSEGSSRTGNSSWRSRQMGLLSHHVVRLYHFPGGWLASSRGPHI